MQLYEPAHARLCRFVQTLVWNADDAKDIVAETTLIAYERFETLKKPEQFLYFLFAIASNLVKKKNRRKKFWGLFESVEVVSRADNHRADEQLLRKELYVALNKLPRKQNEAIVLFEITGFSIKEISNIQGLTESGVKSNLKRGKEKLGKLLLERQPDLSVGDAQVELTIERRGYGK
jgi:RNA polymerase sigma-70 factor (ECF subfamily)